MNEQRSRFALLDDSTAIRMIVATGRLVIGAILMFNAVLMPDRFSALVLLGLAMLLLDTVSKDRRRDG